MSRVAVTAFIFFLATTASAFDLVDTSGKRHRLADYQGRWVVLNFWATWCVPCIQEIPEIAEFGRAHPRVVVIGVAVDAEDVARVKRFAAKTGHDYPLVLGDEGVARQLGEPRALPTTRIYDAAGKVVYDRIGRVTRRSLEEATRSAPATSASSDQRSRSALRTRSG